MANQLSKSGITNSQTIQAWHVSQSVDALTGTSAYDIKISGSLTLTGSVESLNGFTGNLIGTSSWSNNAVAANTASWAINAHTASNAEYLDFTPLVNGAAPAYKDGRLYYSSDDGALTFFNGEADIALQIGQEFYKKAYNDSGNPILNGTPVRISGSQGDMPLIWPATAEDHTAAFDYNNHIIGIATHTIEDSTSGYITEAGLVRNINTNGFDAGDILFLQTGSPANPEDYYRNTPPPFPYDVIQVGFCIKSANNGFIEVNTQEPIHFGNISGLSGSVSEVGSLWVYQSNGAWAPSQTLSGSYTLSGSLDSTEGFTGSLLGTASNAVSSSYAVSASYVPSTEVVTAVIYPSGSVKLTPAPFKFIAGASKSGPAGTVTVTVDEIATNTLGQDCFVTATPSGSVGANATVVVNSLVANTLEFATQPAELDFHFQIMYI